MYNVHWTVSLQIVNNITSLLHQIDCGAEWKQSTDKPGLRVRTCACACVSEWVSVDPCKSFYIIVIFVC